MAIVRIDGLGTIKDGYIEALETVGIDFIGGNFKKKRNYSPLLSARRLTGVNEIGTLTSHL